VPDTPARPGSFGSKDGAPNAASRDLRLRECSVAAAWNLQGDPSAPPFRAWADAFVGAPLPVAANTTATGEQWTALWLGPRSWLVLGRAERSFEEFVAQRDAVNATGGALFDITASRVAFEISGAHAAQLLAAYCPLDLHPAIFTPGTCAQSLLGHVNALYWAPASAVFTVFVARSLARDIWQCLCETGARHGAAPIAAQVAPLPRWPANAES